MVARPGHQKTGLFPAQPGQGHKPLVLFLAPIICAKSGGSYVGTLSVELGFLSTVQSVILFRPYEETGIPVLITVGGETEAGERKGSGAEGAGM